VGYRFGFQGQERDDEIAGSGNSYTAEYWQYDTRLGRRWNLDPKPYPSISQYACFANYPIWFSDPFGDTIRIAYTNKKTGEVSLYTYGSGDKRPKDKLLRQTVRTLDKIQRKGADPMGIINYLSKHEMDVVIMPDSRWGGRALIAVGEQHRINWSPTSGYVSPDGKVFQKPALGLLHELAESYYVLADPERRVAFYPFLFKMTDDRQFNWSSNEFINCLNEIEEWQKRDAGDYDTWNDKWIIQNVETEFNKAFKDTDRDTHKGYHTKTRGPFSEKARKYWNHKENKSGKIKDLGK
jgi:hypothetical protein